MKYMIFATILITLFMASCKNNKEVTEAPVALRYLALGDSYTIGEGVGRDETFPALLVSELATKLKLDIEPEIIAKTGWTTGQLISAISQADLQGSYDLVTLLIGVNNQYRGMDKTQYRLEFRELLQKSVTLARNEGKRVIVLSIPDYGVTPFAAGMDPQMIAEEINAFNAINLDETSKTDAFYIEITSVSRQAASDKSLLAGDSLHPSKKMYQEWVNKMLPTAESILSAKNQ